MIISYSSSFIYIASVASVSANVNSVSILNGTNFKDWKRNMEIVLNCISLKHSLAMVCSEVNLASVPSNTWWLDSSATTNIIVSM